MSDNALTLAVARLVDAANGHRGLEPAQPFRDAMNDLAALDGPNAEERRSCVGTALADVTSPSGAGLIALWLGASVEHGADPLPQIQPLLDCFLRFTRQVKTEDGEVIEDGTDEELAFGLELVGQGFVAHLSRAPEGLRAVQANAEAVAELERVESYSLGPMWVLELIRKVSGELIVLHGEQPVGAKVEYRNISNCFHLFTLLQAALKKAMPGARKITANVLAVAHGRRLAECRDEAWWHYGQPVSRSPDLMTSVYGEESPQQIGSIDGQQVMLLWPPIVRHRAWNAGFFGPALKAAPAAVELIKILSPEEVITWRQRIGLPTVPTTAARKPWWMFW